MRTIVIGDVHGCARELKRLIEKLDVGAADRVFAVGDFVTKGPDPIGALELWREAGHESVLGNNESRVLRAIEKGSDDQSVSEAASLLESRPDLVEWIRTWPVAIEHERTFIVHGGLFPHMSSIEEIKEAGEDVLRLRYLEKTKRGWRRIPSSESSPGDIFWASIWNGPNIVIYGHTPDYEVVRWKHAIGIDTGCVYGGALTAAIGIDQDWSFISQPAERVWYAP